MCISSRSNARVKWVRGLRERKERERSGLFFVEGVHLVAAAVEAGAAAIEMLVVAPDLVRSERGREIVRAQKQRGVPCLEVAPDVFRSLAFKDVAQGIGAVVHQRWERLETVEITAMGGPWVALDGVQYPGNLGTILRTCDAVGGGGVFLLGHATDPYDPAAVRASMGGVFTQRLVRTRFDEFAAWKGRRGVTVAGTSPSAPTDYRTVPYRPPFVLLMGCERGGLSAEHQAACDVMVRIPMVGRCDSLNLAISTGVVLYEAFHQSRAAGY